MPEIVKAQTGAVASEDGMSDAIARASLDDVRVAFEIVDSDSSQPLTLLDRIFPSKTAKARERGEAEIIRQVMEQRVAAVRILGRCKSEFLEKVLAEYLARGLAQSSDETQRVVNVAARSMTARLQESLAQMGAVTAQRLMDAAKLPEAVRAPIEREIFSTLEDFIVHSRTIYRTLNERVAGTLVPR